MDPTGDRRRGVGRRHDDLRSAALIRALDRYLGSVSELVDALRADPDLPAAVGARLDEIDRELTRVLSRTDGVPEDEHVLRLAAHLTRREWQCLRMLAQGLGTAAIAGAMGVTTTTVRSHVQSLLAKLGVNSRLQVVALTAHTSLLAAEPAGIRNNATAGGNNRVRLIARSSGERSPNRAIDPHVG